MRRIALISFVLALVVLSALFASYETAEAGIVWCRTCG
jgi:hypothetical protein